MTPKRGKENRLISEVRECRILLDMAEKWDPGKVPHWTEKLASAEAALARWESK